MNDERNKLLTFIAVEWTGNQRVFTNRGRNGQELPPPEPRTARTLSRMARAGEEERGYRQGPFVPVGATNRDQNPYICPDWRLHPGPLVSGAFGPGWFHQPEQKGEASVPVGASDQWSRLEPPTGTIAGALVLVGGSNRDKRPLPPPCHLG